MCGICGYVTNKNITLTDLKAMNDTMFHRGPNDSGEEIYPLQNGYALGFAQRRLSIMDLSSLGHQPMHSSEGSVSVVFNGEIYNYQELRQELSDYPFRSNCDTEVILAGYLKKGIAFIREMKGMFAVAIYDRSREKLYLVRDRAGKKPLYYYQKGTDFVFASELKPLMAYSGFEKEIDPTVMGRYMFHFYIAEPDSIFQNVKKVIPGEVLTYDLKNHVLQTSRYWDLTCVYQMKKKEGNISSYEEAVQKTKELLVEATRKRMIADVPLGTFLSGGYDSSVITAIAQSLSEEPVKTFSIGFEDPSKDEAPYARKIAEHLGTCHTERYINEKDLLAMVESIPKYFDEPFADSSQIPTMLVSGLAREEVTVALSGDGGDELFCGYQIYPKVANAQKIDWLGGMTYAVCHAPLIRNANLMEKLPFPVRVIANNRNRLTKTQIGGEDYIKKIHSLLISPCKPVKYAIEDKYEERNWQARRMLLDEETYLPGDILCKVDRASMKYSLETRCPILDTDVWEYSYRIPHQYKVHNGIKKSILKDIAYQYIPKELLDRPKKGFSVPLDTWLRGPLKQQLLDYCEISYLKRQNIFHANKMKEFIEWYLKTGDQGAMTGANYSKMAWTFFVFEQWYEAYM